MVACLTEVRIKLEHGLNKRSNNRMEEIRIDCLNQTEQELAAAKELRQNIFRLNHTMPDTEEYSELLHKVFPCLGENCRVEIPFSGVRTANVKFGRNVIIMPGCLMMSAGGITIEDDVLIAANVQLISNNHDLEQRNIITCKPVRICRKAWIGALTRSEIGEAGRAQQGDSP